MESRDRLLGLLKRYAWNASSFQALEPAFRYWFAGDDAAVAYFDTGQAWVVAGPPVAAEERLGDVARRFAKEAAAHRRRALFFGVEERFLHAIDMRAIAIGEQPWWDPRRWSQRHRGHRSLKEQVRRARAKGVVVERAHDVNRQEVNAIIGRWLESRVMPPMTFLVELTPFVCATERRYYVARRGDAMVGVLVAVPIYQRNGWFFEDIIRDPSAPNGTAEALVNAAMLDTAADNCAFVTLGLAPLSGDARWLRTTRALMTGFYNFEGLHAFKAKLRPDGWDPIYAAWPDDGTPLTAIYDSLDAFAGGEIFRFAVRAILRAPSPVLFALGTALIPWVMVMAAADTKRWFPSRTVQRAWLAFDVVMCGAFVSLSRRWRQDLAIGACAAAAADGALTAIQAARYNARRIRGATDALVAVAAITAPFAAAAILLGGLRRHASRPAAASGRAGDTPRIPGRARARDRAPRTESQ